MLGRRSPLGVPTIARRTLLDVPSFPSPRLPAPLQVAASLVAVEGLLVVGYAVLEAAAIHRDRAAMGVTSALFFAALGVALVACVWFVSRGRSWARSPILVSQLLFLGMAWSFLGGATTWISIVLGLVAVVVLLGMFHPASMDALGGGPYPHDETTDETA